MSVENKVALIAHGYQLVFMGALGDSFIRD